MIYKIAFEYIFDKLDLSWYINRQLR
jgi:hypothetical protein